MTAEKPKILMANEIALSLLRNTTLTYGQISDFCGIPLIDVEAIHNKDHKENTSLSPMDPIAIGVLTREEIERCSQDPQAKLISQTNPEALLFQKSKPKQRYTPLNKRQNRRHAIAWLLKHSRLSDAQICRLLGTTLSTIQAIRSKTYAYMDEIKAQDPVFLGLCTQAELNEAIAKNPQIPDNSSFSNHHVDSSYEEEWSELTLPSSRNRSRGE